MLSLFWCLAWFYVCEVCVFFFLLWDLCASGLQCLVPALAAQFQQPLVVESASAVTVYPASALALQGVWSQSFVPLCCSCLFSSLGVFTVAFCHLGLLSHTILLLFLAWGSSFGVGSGLGLRCCGPGYGSSHLLCVCVCVWVGGGGGGGLSFPCPCCFSLAFTTFSFCPDNLDFLDVFTWVSFSRLTVFHW